jgi:hypothetical protein
MASGTFPCARLGKGTVEPGANYVPDWSRSQHQSRQLCDRSFAYQTAILFYGLIGVLGMRNCTRSADAVRSRTIVTV